MKNKIIRLIWMMNYDIHRRNPRPSFRYTMLKFPNKDLKCAEIGVWQGENAKSMLKTGKVESLYLIDTWKEYNDFDGTLISQDILDKALLKTKKRIKSYKDKVILIREDSIKAIDLIPNDFDYIYLDGNHDYEYIKNEIRLYFDKLNKGGILAGHDINCGFNEDLNGIPKAVIEFCYVKDLICHILNADWWVVKGETKC